VTVEWTPLAIGHLEAVFEHMAERSPEAADAVIERILSAVDNLEQHPGMGRTGRVAETRELVITRNSFVVAYRQRKDSIDVLAVLHGARRWPEKF
jgi:addiction module RelE/StbE family toxin